LFNKRKIINDPVYGFISIPSDLIYDLIQEPVFQRLRRIRQLGLTDLVYPGALHTRFHHALGAMHLMSKTLDSFRRKGHYLSDEESEAALIAILLHDIGHGPFSHTLEHSLFSVIPHEELSLLIMKNLNQKYDGRLTLAIQIFTDQYQRKFFHELVSSQLDMDRLDYLKRDSYFTGVSEGDIGSERIIQMLNISEERLVVEEKGIYSIENFLSARRLMYWQVYLHKTTICADRMLNNVVDRARYLYNDGVDLFVPVHLKTFFNKDVTIENFSNDQKYLESYTFLDDFDIWYALKVWAFHSDKVLADLSHSLISRNLFQINISNERPGSQLYNAIKNKVKARYALTSSEVEYYVSKGSISNSAYIAEGKKINILMKDGRVIDITEAADLPNIKAMSKIVRKYYLYWPKHISL